MRISDDGRDALEKWAYSDAPLDSWCLDWGADEADDPDDAIRRICSLEDAYRFSADARCPKRRFFSYVLAEQLSWIFVDGSSLPYHFSRLQGLVDHAGYIKAAVDRAERVYERCRIIEEMRSSPDIAMQSIANTLLDYRNERVSLAHSSYQELRRTLVQRLDSAFK